MNKGEKEEEEMTIISRLTDIVGGIVGLLIGENITTPILKEMEARPLQYLW